MATEDQAHVALPKLYGAPAYARPLAVAVVKTARPVDPDDLPLESEQTEEERQLARGLSGSGGTGTSGDHGSSAGDAGRRGPGRSFVLRAITQRVRVGNGARADG